MSLHKFLDDPERQKKVLANFGLLQELGILDYLDKVAGQFNNRETLLDEAGELFRQESLKDVIALLAKTLLSKFVPSYLLFIYEGEGGEDKPVVSAFKNTQEVNSPVNIDSFEPYRHLFSLSPASMDFNAFEYMVGRPEYTDVFLPIKPAKVIPIISFSGPIGMVLIGEKVVGKTYDEEENLYIDRLIRFGSLAFQNILHYQRAIIDFKTRLYNHLFFTRRMDEELARIKRYGSKLTVLILDVDHFKQFNDTHGHMAGDLALVEVAKILKSSIRQEDVAARFGGEEFVLMLIQCDSNYGWLIGERIRKRIMKHRFSFEGKSLGITVSLGISHAEGNGHHPSGPQLLQEADQALYESKKGGRNRSTVFKDLK
jgi:diguanylate cyclase (GGDEF)-like protein